MFSHAHKVAVAALIAASAAAGAQLLVLERKRRREKEKKKRGEEKKGRRGEEEKGRRSEEEKGRRSEEEKGRRGEEENGKRGEEEKGRRGVDRKCKRKKEESYYTEELESQQIENDCHRPLESEPELEEIKSFKNLTKMDDKVFETLIKIVRSSIERQDTQMRKAVTAREKLAATLCFLTTGASYKSLRSHTDLSIAFLSQEIPAICDVLYKKLKGTHLKIPSSQAEWDQIASEFHSRWDFPLCIGALDTKRIVCRAPKENCAFYRIGKGVNSRVLLALVDANCRIIYANAGCNGVLSDDEVLTQSNLMETVEYAAENFQFSQTIGDDRELPYVIAASSAFKLHRHLMKPYPRTDLETKTQIFNYRLSRARRSVEHAMEILAKRFRVLQSTINLDGNKVDIIIKACCVLYNFLLDTNEREMMEAVASSSADQTIDSGLMDELVNEVLFNEEQNAMETRNEFAEYFSNEGNLYAFRHQLKTN